MEQVLGGSGCLNRQTLPSLLLLGPFYRKGMWLAAPRPAALPCLVLPQTWAAMPPREKSTNLPLPMPAHACQVRQGARDLQGPAIDVS